jgi:molybdopterin-guanine dinucleotide biosynthesis protein A
VRDAARATLPCTGVVLAGGRARRLDGRAKGLEHVGGRRIVDRVAHALRQVSDDLLLAATDPAAAGWLPDARVVRDVVPDAGPLGGLHAALRTIEGGALVVAWDMPFVPASLLGELRAEGERTGAAAVVPERDAEGRVEPLCAWYAERCAADAEAALAAGERAMGAFVARVGARRLPHSRVVDWGDPDRLFLNVNTADALAWADALARGDAPPAPPR